MRSRTLRVLAFFFIVSVGLSMIGASSAQTPGAVTNISKKSGNQSETSVAINPTDPNNVVIFSNEESANGLFMGITTDGGTNWVASDVATGSDGLPQACCDPTAKFDEFGNLFLCYIDLDFSTGPHTTVALSVDKGQTFKLLKTFPGSHDQPTLVTGAGSVWVVWKDFSVSGTPLVASGAAVTGLNQVAKFSPPQSAVGSGPSSFGDIAIGPQGQVMIVAQDNIPSEGPSNIWVNVDPDGLGPLGFQPAVKVGTTNVGGFDYIAAQNGRSVDAETGLAWDRSGGPFNGRVYLVFSSEQPDESDDLDVMLTHSDDNGFTWSPPIRVNDDATKNSQFLPKIAIDQTSGIVAVVWHDCRNDNGVPGPDSTNTIPNDDAEFYCAMSVDGGASFLSNVQIASSASNSADSFNGIDYGDYIGLDFYGGKFFPAWADNSNATGDNPDGKLNQFDIYTSAIDVVAPVIRLQLVPSRVFAGDTAVGKITLRDPAPPGGAVVTVTSSNLAVAQVPDTVTVPEGLTTAEFDIPTADTGSGLTVVDIGVQYNGFSDSQKLTVVPFVVAVEFLDLIDWVPDISVTGGQLVQARVIIAQLAPTPDGVVVNLTSGDPNICQVTPTVTVPAGTDRQYFYVFTTPVAYDQPVEIRASARGSTAAGIVTVLAPVPYKVTLSPTTVEGGNPSGGTVYLTGPAPNTGLDVALSSDKAEAFVDAVVHIQPGKDNGTFVVNTFPVANKVVANISASYNGVSASAPLTITGAGLQAFSINPSQISAGMPARATAVLSSPAPAGGVNVALSYVNGNALVNPPASIPISAGATTGSVNLVGAMVTNSTQVTVKATYKATSKQASVTVLGNRVVSVTANPQTLHVGTKSSCRVYLAAPAPTGGVVVNLAATSGELPVSVRILAGQNNASFNYKAPATVPAGGKATITATYPASVSVTTVVSIIP